VLANDPFDDVAVDPASVRIVAIPAHGHAEVNSVTGAIDYTPDTGFLGVERIHYVVSDTLQNGGWSRSTRPFAPTTDMVRSGHRLALQCRLKLVGALSSFVTRFSDHQGKDEKTPKRARSSAVRAGDS
jgi:hypothetical protein